MIEIRILFVLLIALVLFSKLYLNRRQIQSIRNHYNQVPQNFTQQITLDEHQKAGLYNIEKLKFANLELWVSTILTLLLTLGGVINLINDIVYSALFPGLTTQVLVIIGLLIINSLVGLPFSIYETFKIEQKFGFNRTTVKLFITDLIKGTILSALIGIPLMYLVFWLMNIMGNSWWIWVWGLLVIFNLIALVIYPILIAPLFNKFTPLDDAELSQKITNLLTRCGFKSKGVFIMDGSKRSSHGNAYFTGIGKSKRIVFFDTLIKALTPDEIEAVLAHELGHFKKKHVLKQIIVSFLISLVLLFSADLLIHNETFFAALNINDITNANGLVILSLVSSFVMFPFSPLSKYFSRKNEFEADDFAKQYSKPEHLINGLVKLYRDNASTLTPDPVYVKFYYSHPPATTRIANLEKN